MVFKSGKPGRALAAKHTSAAATIGTGGRERHTPQAARAHAASTQCAVDGTHRQKPAKAPRPTSAAGDPR